MDRSKGFTLIELMIVVAVVAILASVAYPSYSRYVERGKLADAAAGLSQYRVLMEQYFQDNRNYGVAGADCPASFAGLNQTYFTFTCTVGDPNTSYVATATSKAGAVGSTAGFYTFSINEANAKSTSKFRGTSVSKTCWAMRGDEC